MSLIILQYEQRNQVRENSTNFVSIFQSNVNEVVQAFIKICNVSDDDVECDVCHDVDGSTYDQSTALFWNVTIPRGETLEIDHVFVNNSNGNIAYRSAVANALTATVYTIMRDDS